ncbi:hypothetical protein CCR75_007233 [Bremia lactucae]|uniref:Uncharacterized protein n=1 Tax=Bremia lactucae TaxID=4779 RepID=A0A976IH67_BRELC|nr:hypothetical protein CCR75_007233 [Bremia lactucae]
MVEVDVAPEPSSHSPLPERIPPVEIQCKFLATSLAREHQWCRIKGTAMCRLSLTKCRSKKLVSSLILSLSACVTSSRPMRSASPVISLRSFSSCLGLAMSSALTSSSSPLKILPFRDQFVLLPARGVHPRQRH